MNRRDFFKKAAQGAAAVAVGSLVPFPKRSSLEDMLDFDSSWVCTMNPTARMVDLVSETVTVLVDCPSSIIFVGFNPRSEWRDKYRANRIAAKRSQRTARKLAERMA